MAYKEHFAKKTIQQLKIKSYHFCSFHMLLMRYIFLGSSLKLHNSIPSSCRVIFINYGRTDGRMDKHDVYRTIIFSRSCNVLKVNPSEKINSIQCQTNAKTDDHIKLKLYFISQHPCTDSRHNGKCNICAFHEEIQCIWRLDFCQIINSCSCFWMDHKSKQVYSLINQFMTSEGRDNILHFTSKTGQSVL